MGGPGSGRRKEVAVDDFRQPLYHPDYIPEPFNGVTFPAIVSAPSIRLNNDGALAVTVIVPIDYVEEAMKLRLAALQGGLVAIRAEPWNPFENEFEGAA